MSEATVDIGVKQEKAHEDWQALKSNWKGRMSHLYNNEIMSDITFKVQDERFKAHKFVMASASSVFYAMFYGPVAEQRLEIEIVDCANSEDFTEFLKFVYTEELSLTWDNVFAVAYLAKKYYIPSLTDECCRFLLRSLTMENVLSVLNLSVAADQQEMAKECLQLIKVQIRKLSRTPEFLELDRDTLKAILELDVLDMKEIDVFRAVDKWCKYQLEKKGQDVSQEAKREILGEVRNLLRFPTLPTKLLANDCYPSGLITKDQFLELVCFLQSEDLEKHKNVDKDKIPFENKRRTRSNYYVECETEATEYDDSYGSCFRVSEKVWLKGLTVMDNNNFSSFMRKEKVIIIKGEDGTTRKLAFSIQDPANHEDKFTHLIFKTPVEILPNVEYNVLDREKRNIKVGCKQLLDKTYQHQLAYTTLDKPSWYQASKSSHGQIKCEIIAPSVCKCWGPSWKMFPGLFFSKHDNLKIREEEVIICEIAKREKKSEVFPVW
eukprot:Seg1146.2 transcript_id=Seg1146.2/GoldUCD/mRNA.D3Y31 product="BTB/POZ domain-containing protein 2" protein_id=Seg1146.2/GoldUCD/D3Y31